MRRHSSCVTVEGANVRPEEDADEEEDAEGVDGEPRLVRRRTMSLSDGGLARGCCAMVGAGTNSVADGSTAVKNRELVKCRNCTRSPNRTGSLPRARAARCSAKLANHSSMADRRNSSSSDSTLPPAPNSAAAAENRARAALAPALPSLLLGDDRMDDLETVLWCDGDDTPTWEGDDATAGAAICNPCTCSYVNRFVTSNKPSRWEHSSPVGRFADAGTSSDRNCTESSTNPSHTTTVGWREREG